MIDDPDFIWRHHNACSETNSNRRIIAQSNKGFTLLSLDFDSTVLWNILTNKLRILPRIRGDSIGSFGFGYDVASDDYKLVRIFWNQSFTKVIVYSLRANSWRWIEDLPDYCSFYSFYQLCGIFIASTLSWMEPMKSRESTAWIISFDLKSEKFHKLSVLVHDITTTNVGEWDTTVNVLGGCLCLSRNDGCELVVDIWVMKEYNVKDSWTKLFSFSYLSLNIYGSMPPIVKSLFYSKTGEKVFPILNNLHVIRHDLK
ncbi:hypothetical protein ACOSQ2_009444 [Xanthoceras sorbifolium]|uniref:F-box associated beta-propeller type 1 domain-containing protein n=1 Tax=Xanthoceras sorbifolium TaxID=99658 RepID=A0ABQ8HVQ2_9ROSI|nr:hypothetical protein JRO89_XS07G0279000 [Xanthoceras sorbifolium]